MNKLYAFGWAIMFILLGFLWGAAQVVVIPLSTALALFGKGKFHQYGVNCWEGKDNLISAQTGGDPDDSLSSRLGKARAKGSGWGYIANKVDLVALELFNDPDHCNASIENNEGKKQVTTY
jgi:hypothetical protein